MVTVTCLLLNKFYNPIEPSVVIAANWGGYNEYMQVYRRQNGEYVFRLMSDPEDPLARWVEPKRYIGQEGIEFAKAEIERLDQEMIELRERFAQTELYKAMAAIVEQHVKEFKSDFYVHDCTWIAHEEPGQFFWYVEEWGTRISEPGSEYAECLENEYNQKLRSSTPWRRYYYDDKKLREVP